MATAIHIERITAFSGAPISRSIRGCYAIHVMRISTCHLLAYKADGRRWNADMTGQEDERFEVSCKTRNDWAAVYLS